MSRMHDSSGNEGSSNDNDDYGDVPGLQEQSVEDSSGNEDSDNENKSQSARMSTQTR